MRLAVALAGAALLALPASAGAVKGPASYQVGSPPPACAPDLFTDLVLTDGDDSAIAPFRATRLWGLAGSDQLTGSPTRATCIFGGRGDDRLTLGTGGGIAYGEAGDDTILGTDISDAVVGGDGVDAISTAGGDDAIDSRDGLAELIDCGAGDDTVTGDRIDVLIACETARLKGPKPVRLGVAPAKVGYRGIPKVRMRVPRSGNAGDYRVVLLTGRTAGATPGCTGGPVELTRFPDAGRQVLAGQRVKFGLRPPKGGYCRGPQKAIVLYLRSVDGPAEPVARLSFRVTGS